MLAAQRSATLAWRPDTLAHVAAEPIFSRCSARKGQRQSTTAAAALPKAASLANAVRKMITAADSGSHQQQQQSADQQQRRRQQRRRYVTSEEEEEEDEQQEQQQQVAEEQEGAAAEAEDNAGEENAEGEAGAAEGAEAALPAETEAAAGAEEQGKQELVTEEVEEIVEQVVEPLTFQSAATRSQAFLTTTLPGKLLLGGLAAALLGSLGLAAVRVWQKANTARAKRMRQIDRNRELVEGLNGYLLAGNRAGLTAGVLKRIQRASGFSCVEVFRKYLWYLLRERKFDVGAVEDLVALKNGLGLTDADAGEALRERSARIYDKYGTLMLNTEGLTLTGAQRKATCTALFRKLLYLAECERLVGAAATEPGGSGVGSVADIGKIFGATLEDMERLRIRNLYEAELDLEGMMGAEEQEEEEQGQQQK
ncbi:hypothetical protein Agub_g15631 [Astrephomene gubernaculifera]|uniref:Armadillo-like repeats domain-containing protein n=1 Tax=Astrephomene gubernaculifera TaxID=47775 RepID=A0AAD3E5H8_9CHLO|nr:hypothetical protein Agub_g15631 [Astrephomene gubernaculifera]